MILGITGHRPPGVGGYTLPNETYTKLVSEIRKRFELLKPEKIISGMAVGTDQYAISVALDMGIPFIAAVPFVGQESMWPESSKKQYKEYLDKAAEVVVVSPGAYSPDKMHTRDQWIVDKSDSLLGVWNGQPRGGTFSTIRYAQKVIMGGREGFDIFLINPDGL